MKRNLIKDEGFISVLSSGVSIGRRKGIEGLGSWKRWISGICRQKVFSKSEKGWDRGGRG
jgi:hypothetical protein